MKLTLSRHQAYLMREAVTGLANVLDVMVSDGASWLGRTLADVEQLEEILLSGHGIDADHDKIGEAA